MAIGQAILKDLSDNWWVILMRGIIAVQPDAGALAVVWTIGAYALVVGIALIVLSFRVRVLGGHAGTHATACPTWSVGPTHHRRGASAPTVAPGPRAHKPSVRPVG